MENYGYIWKVIDRDFNTFFGKELKTLFEATLIKFKQFNRLGGYWDSKADNEIDIVAIDDLSKRSLIAEVKRQATKFNINDYTVDQRCFSLDNLDDVMSEFTRE